MSTYADRLKALREQLKSDRLDGFVVPLTDEHMSEYVGSYAQRLAWLTGFQGSAGSAVVLPEEAAIFTDGRYTLQVRTQVDGKDWSYQSVPETSIADWLKDHAPEGGAHRLRPVAAHPRLGEEGEGSAGRARRRAGRGRAEPDRQGLGRPARGVEGDAGRPARPICRQELGREAHRHRRLAGEQGRRRGGAVRARFDRLGVQRARRRTSATRRSRWLMPWSMPTAPPTCSSPARRSGPTSASTSATASACTSAPTSSRRLPQLAGKTVAVDPERAVAAIFDALEKAGAKVIAVRDPTVLPKAIKNPVEIAGQKAAQHRDGAAIARFLKWIDDEAPRGEVDELTASDRLEAFRKENAELRDLSFDTISGAGPNGAIVHYRSDETTNRKLQPGELYLVDSGGQYVDGTTDITRTVPIGEPTDEMRDRFTRVLKGHIAIDTALFPKGTRGTQLDSFARRPLWEAGLDYAHGTGHGVGSFLSVHEGPQRISPVGSSQSGGDEPLQAGMILSNEPGYYKAGEYGIRIENLVLVVEKQVEGAEKEMLGFETLTFAPIDRRLIVKEMLSPTELDWLNRYHAQVLEKLGPSLEGADREWLEAGLRAALAFGLLRRLDLPRLRLSPPQILAQRGGKPFFALLFLAHRRDMHRAARDGQVGLTGKGRTAIGAPPP